MRDIPAFIGIALLVLGLAIAGCRSTDTSPSSPAYPIISPLDPVTEEVINVSR